MGDMFMIDFILWFVVYPLLLFLCLLAYKAIYHSDFMNRWRKERFRKKFHLDD